MLSTLAILVYPTKKEVPIEKVEIETVEIDTNIYAVAYVEAKSVERIGNSIEDFEYEIFKTEVQEEQFVKENEIIHLVKCKEESLGEIELFNINLDYYYTLRDSYDFNILYLQKEIIRIDNEIEKLSMTYASDKVKKDELLKEKHTLLVRKAELSIEMKNNENNIKQLSYEFEELKDKCNVTSIKSPFSGYIKSINDDEVEIISNQKVLKVSLSEDEISVLKKHQEVEIELGNGEYKGVKFRSYIDSISIFPQLNNGVVSHDITIPVPDSFPYGYKVLITMNKDNEVMNIQEEKKDEEINGK
jgi:hypothetical protein